MYYCALHYIKAIKMIYRTSASIEEIDFNRVLTLVKDRLECVVYIRVYRSSSSGIGLEHTVVIKTTTGVETHDITDISSW